MARVSFESLPPYAMVGGVLSGFLPVETDKPLQSDRVTVTLRGAEITQVTVHRAGRPGQGASSQVLTQTAPFLEQSILPAPIGSIGPGTFRLPFSFTLPADAPPSLATTPLPRTRGRLSARPNGCYVEYELDGKIDVPWWISPLDREVIPVLATRRGLGAVPPVRIPPEGNRPSVLVDFDSPAVVPGEVVQGSFELVNNAGKHLRSLTIGLERTVQYTADGVPGQAAGPTFSVMVPLDTRDPTRAGRFRLPIPDGPEVTGPGQGTLYRSYWSLTVHVDIELGFDLRFSMPLNPG